MSAYSKYFLGLLCLIAVLAGCGDGAPGPKSSLVGGDSDVAVELAPELAGQIEVVSASVSDDSSNARDVKVVLRNTGRQVARLELEGRWETRSGAFRGGAATVLELQVGQTELFSTATMSKDAKRFRLSIVPATRTQDDMLTETLASDTPIAEGQGMTFTESPSLDAIPPWTIRGVANGLPFTSKSVVIMPFRDVWRIEISDVDVDPFKGMAEARFRHPDVQTIHIDLAEEPASGTTLERAMAYGGGYFQIKLPEPGEGTTSWNTSIAWAIEFTDWQRQSWDADRGGYQQAGTASGRLYVAFKGREDGIRDSWVSGTFTDVPIMFYGPYP